MNKVHFWTYLLLLTHSQKPCKNTFRNSKGVLDHPEMNRMYAQYIAKGGNFLINDFKNKRGATWDESEADLLVHYTYIFVDVR